MREKRPVPEGWYEPWVELQRREKSRETRLGNELPMEPDSNAACASMAADVVPGDSLAEVAATANAEVVAVRAAAQSVSEVQAAPSAASVTVEPRVEDPVGVVADREAKFEAEGKVAAETSAEVTAEARDHMEAEAEVNAAADTEAAVFPAEIEAAEVPAAAAAVAEVAHVAASIAAAVAEAEGVEVQGRKVQVDEVPTVSDVTSPPAVEAARVLQLLYDEKRDHEELASLRSAMGTLGGCELVDERPTSSRVTHVVVVSLKRTEKSLGIMAAGRWLVHSAWVHESLAQGAWLPEAAYEVHRDDADDGAPTTVPFGKGVLWMGAARRQRLRRERGEAGPFSGAHFVVVQGTMPDAPTLRRILRVGGAIVADEDVLPQASDQAVLVVVPRGTTSSSCAPVVTEAMCRGLACVPPEYVIEQLTQREPQDLAAMRLQMDF